MDSENTKLKQKKFDNFFEEYCGSDVRVVLHNEKVINGKIVESRRYWLKLESGGTTYYINKAWILYIQPLKLVRK